MAGHPRRPPERRAPKGPWLHGPAKGSDRPLRPPFAPGNTLSQTHGAGDGHSVATRPTQKVQALAETIVAATMEHLDGACPDHLTWPQFKAAVVSWARRESRAKILSDYLDGKDVEEWISPPTHGKGPSAPSKTLFELWLAAEHSAAKARKDLGLDPASWAGILKDLGIAGKVADDAIARLGAQGAKIAEERNLRMVQGSGEG